MFPCITFCFLVLIILSGSNLFCNVGDGLNNGSPFFLPSFDSHWPWYLLGYVLKIEVLAFFSTPRLPSSDLLCLGWQMRNLYFKKCSQVTFIIKLIRSPVLWSRLFSLFFWGTKTSYMCLQNLVRLTFVPFSGKKNIYEVLSFNM